MGAPLRLNSQVVVLKLRRHAKADEVRAAFTTSPELSHCREMVHEAGCQLQPEWANGSWMLVPVTEEQFEEADLKTCAYHVFVRAVDEETVIRVLRKCVPEGKWPKPKIETLDGVMRGGDCSDQVVKEIASEASQNAAASSMDESAAERAAARTFEPLDIVVERTFVHFRVSNDDGQSVSHSAPF